MPGPDSARLDRDAQERIRVSIRGNPASEWEGLTGADVQWSLTADVAGEEIILEKDDDDDGLTIQQDGGGQDAGEITVDLSSDETGDIPPGGYYQWVLVEDTGGDWSVGETDPHLIVVRDTPLDQLR